MEMIEKETFYLFTYSGGPVLYPLLRHLSDVLEFVFLLVISHMLMMSNGRNSRTIDFNFEDWSLIKTVQAILKYRLTRKILAAIEIRNIYAVTKKF